MPHAKRRGSISEQETLDTLVDKLKTNKTVKKIERNKPYSSHISVGELDLYVETLVNRIRYYHYYEVKANNNLRQLDKGKAQICRWMDYMHIINRIPYYQLKGIIVTPQKLYRVHYGN